MSHGVLISIFPRWAHSENHTFDTKIIKIGSLVTEI